MRRHRFLFVAMFAGALATLFLVSSYLVDGQPASAVAKLSSSFKLKNNYLRHPREKEAKPQLAMAKVKVGGEGHRILVGKGDAQFPVVVVSGTPYEMGWHIGHLMRAEMEHLIPAAMAGMGHELHATPQALQEAWSRAAAFTDPRFQQELVGLADGSGIPLATLQAVHVLPLLSPYSCSSLAAWGKATEDGHLYQTRNLDWSMELHAHDFPVVLVYLPKQGIAHVVPSFAGMIGAHTGMNARGIALSEMGDSRANEMPYDLMAPHFTTFFRTLLYDADSLTRALEIFQATPHTKRYHFVFGDGMTEHRAVKIRAHAPERDPAKRILIWKDNDPTDEFAPKVLENVVYNDEGRGAFPYLKQYYGKLNAEKMIEIACHIPIKGDNVVDVVYDATALRLWISFAKGDKEAYLRPFTLIDLKTLAEADGKPLCAEAFAGTQHQNGPAKLVSVQLDARRQRRAAANPAAKPEGAEDEIQANMQRLRRHFSDRSGKYGVDAFIVAVDESSVRLLRAHDHKEVKVPIVRLSDEDQKWVQSNRSHIEAYGDRVRQRLTAQETEEK